MPAAGDPRRHLANVPMPVRAFMALVGMVVGLLLVFVGARSCESSLEDPAPPTITYAPSTAGAAAN